MITDWDDAYANGAYISGAADYPPKWAKAAGAIMIAEAPPPKAKTHEASL